MWHTGGQNQRVRALHRVTPWCQPWGFMEPATHQQEGSRGGDPRSPQGLHAGGPSNPNNQSEPVWPLQWFSQSLE